MLPFQTALALSGGRVCNSNHVAPRVYPTAPAGTGNPFWKNLVAGGIAGTSEILIMYPLDVVKTRFQLSTTKNDSMLRVLVDSIKQEKFGIYRGILPPILAEAPKRAMKFTANAFFGELYAPKNGKMNQLRATAAGVSAGISEAFIVVPFELVKIRMQAKSNAGLYANSFDAVSKIWKQEGLAAFANGLEPTLWRHALWNGGYFGLIFWVRGILPQAESPSGELLRNFVAGAISGTFGTMLNTPPDVIKTRIQNQLPGQPIKYRFFLPGMMTVLKEEGVGALYKGFLPKVVRLGPGGGILLVVFDFISKLLA